MGSAPLPQRRYASARPSHPPCRGYIGCQTDHNGPVTPDLDQALAATVGANFTGPSSTVHLASHRAEEHYHYLPQYYSP